MGSFKLFSIPDLGVYLSLRAHITTATFDPAAEDGGGNTLYQRIFASIESNRARIQFQFAGRPPSDASIVMVYVNDDLRSLTFPLDWTGSAAHLEIACSVEMPLAVPECAFEFVAQQDADLQFTVMPISGTVGSVEAPGVLYERPPTEAELTQARETLNAIIRRVRSQKPS